MSTAQDITTLLANLPEPAELIRRAQLVHIIHDNLSLDSDRIDAAINAHGDSRYFWEDGSGQEANIIWDLANPTHILLLGYDHESEFNHYDTPDAYVSQLPLRNLPADLAYLGADPALYWSWDDKHLVYASCSAWWDTAANAWTCDPTWLQAADAARDDGGMDYCFEIFTIDPDIEAYVKHLSNQGFDDAALGLRAAVTAALSPTPIATASAPAPTPADATPDTPAAHRGLGTRLRDLFT